MKQVLVRVIRKIYSIQLHLGIKALIYRTQKNTEFFWDNSIAYPLYTKLEGYIRSKIIKHYGADYRWGDYKSQNLGKQFKSLGYGAFHHALVTNLKPRRVLVVGSMYGFIPFMMANACMKNGFGHVDFVDAGFDINGKKDPSTHYFGQRFWKSNDLEEHFSYFLKKGIITPYIMTTKEFAKKYKFTYDYVYLDGDHSYGGALLDIKLFWPRLASRGFLCFHDIHFTRNLKGVKFEFWKIWKDLSPMPYKFELSNMYSGLGYIQKIGGKKIPML